MALKNGYALRNIKLRELRILNRNEDLKLYELNWKLVGLKYKKVLVELGNIREFCSLHVWYWYFMIWNQTVIWKENEKWWEKLWENWVFLRKVLRWCLWGPQIDLWTCVASVSDFSQQVKKHVEAVPIGARP